MNQEMKSILRKIIHAEELGKLSKEAAQLLRNWHAKQQHIEHNRPSWEETYLRMAFTLAKRSHDAETQHGCIIATSEHRPLSWGYNGFPGNIDDAILPNIRPEKYPWMLHSEINALLNCRQSLAGGIVYLTGEPCLHCTMCMSQAGIAKVIYACNYNDEMVGGFRGHKDNTTKINELEILRWLLGDRIKFIPYKLDGA